MRERFVERFARDARGRRRPAHARARVLASLLATDSGRLTAAELAEQLLQASPAAVCGAVRYLIADRGSSSASAIPARAATSTVLHE